MPSQVFHGGFSLCWHFPGSFTDTPAPPLSSAFGFLVCSCFMLFNFQLSSRRLRTLLSTAAVPLGAAYLPAQSITITNPQSPAESTQLHEASLHSSLLLALDLHIAPSLLPTHTHSALSSHLSLGTRHQEHLCLRANFHAREPGHYSRADLWASSTRSTGEAALGCRSMGTKQGEWVCSSNKPLPRSPLPLLN